MSVLGGGGSHQVTRSLDRSSVAWEGDRSPGLLSGAVKIR